jgi:acyl carrier protein
MVNFDKSLNNRELVELLSRYFTERGSFLAQVIRADIQTVSYLSNHQNGHSNSHGNGHSNSHSNGLSTQNPVVQDFVAPTPPVIQSIPESDLSNHQNGHSNSHSNGLSTQNPVIQDFVAPTPPVIQSIPESDLSKHQNGHSNSHSNGLSTQNPVIQDFVAPIPPVIKSLPESEPITPMHPVKPIPPVNQGSKNLSEILVDLVVEQTGYPKESIGLELKLLDDLNLDSIKAGEVIASAAKEWGLAGQLDPLTLVNASLQEVIEVIESAIPVATPLQYAVSPTTNMPVATALQPAVSPNNGTTKPPENIGIIESAIPVATPLQYAVSPTTNMSVETPLQPSQPITPMHPVKPVAQVNQGSKNLAGVLVDLVVEQTGYPKESIGLELKLLDDLNLDSIKAGEVIAAAAKEWGVAGQLDPLTLVNASLQEVIEVIESTIPVATPLQYAVSPTTNMPVASALQPAVSPNNGTTKPPENIGIIESTIPMATPLQSKVSPITNMPVATALQPAVSSNNGTTKPPENNGWVRNFAVEYVAQGK